MTTTIGPNSPGPVRDAVDAACDRVAPTWPLDRFIAVNPYWGWRELPIAEAAGQLGALAGTTLTMPRSWFRDEWAAGRLAEHHLDAVAALGDPDLAGAARAVVHDRAEPATPALTQLPLVTDVVDASRGSAPAPGRTWSDVITHQIGQHCAGHFDEWQATWSPGREHGLFDSWRASLSVTHGFGWRHGSRWARAQLDSLPSEPTAAIAAIVDDLGIDDEASGHYLTAVLASVNGWAAWCAYRRFQARLYDVDDDAIVDLLAVRLAWEWLLASDSEALADALESWAHAWSHTAAALVDATCESQRVDWVLQAAAERTYQDSVISGLADGQPVEGEPDVQAVFCIDVRSEVFRRALESTGDSIQTRGFAGFFGLPISYTPAGSSLTRPQLPGLLAPVLDVSDVVTDRLGRRVNVDRSDVLAERQRWEAFGHLPSSGFSFVETMGLAGGAKLVKHSVPHQQHPPKWESDGLGDAVRLRPRLAVIDDDPAAAALLAQRVLTGMGMLEGFAPMVMLCGHGSLTTNNPHAAGLDCGACGGQTGEVNARVLADLLNDTGVRRELSGLGVDVPASTWFVAALHTTTTDQVELFDTDLAPASHRERIDELEHQLCAAGDIARAERADSLGLGRLAASPQRLERAIAARANDWSEVQPEWGLAGNAAFVVAPRWRTRHVDLHGRCFLHDYDWTCDHDVAVLTLIMTAPMVVTNWINLQYHASTVDNGRYGSGNKVLHNVVGGNIGVFEGNGGDLRIGLPIQSLHDGNTLRHHPLRLSVFIEAPRAAIDAVIASQPVVHDLVSNEWLNLLRIETSDGTVEERSAHGWIARHAGPEHRGPSR